MLPTCVLLRRAAASTRWSLIVTVSCLRTCRPRSSKSAPRQIDKKAIATEEELLIAEKKTIERKKNSKLALLKSIDKGSDTITFEFIPPKNKNERDDIDDIYDDENGTKENDIDKKDRDFKPKDKVLIEEKDKLNSRTIYGEVATLKPDKKI